MYILGVWDGHDSGAALIDDDSIIYAANEERFTKRKLEIAFPHNAIAAALKYAAIKPSDIDHVAYTTTEFTKTLERIYPPMKESYYRFRRRKIPKPWNERFRHNLKYSLTSIGILPLCTQISSAYIRRQLKRDGFTHNYKLHVVEHHTAHAATAAFTSGLENQLVITLDGLGDGLSGSISTLENGKLERKQAIRARDSLGILYEQVTNLLGMRELEDEGKIMAMADYSYPFDFEENKLKDFFKVTGTTMHARYGPLRQYTELEKISWQIPREQTAYMAQQLLEVELAKFVSNALDRYGFGKVSFAGGLFSNVKANMKARNLDALKKWYVFPHMGDGGIALGAALYTNYLITGKSAYKFSAYLGDSFSRVDIESAAKQHKELSIDEDGMKEQGKHAAELIDADNYILWFQGRMEYGPRALGNRSILAKSESQSVKDRLNLYVKKREWFQPFAPSMLEEDASRILKYDDKGRSTFMTMAYETRDESRNLMTSVTHVDGTARPQTVAEENPAYMDLLKNVKRGTGYGVVLNTSFNIHGKPIVMTPSDAIEMMLATKTKYLFMDGYFITNKKGV